MITPHISPLPEKDKKNVQPLGNPATFKNSSSLKDVAQALNGDAAKNIALCNYVFQITKVQERIKTATALNVLKKQNYKLNEANTPRRWEALNKARKSIGVFISALYLMASPLYGLGFFIKNKAFAKIVYQLQASIFFAEIAEAFLKVAENRQQLSAVVKKEGVTKREIGKALMEFSSQLASANLALIAGLGIVLEDSKLLKTLKSFTPGLKIISGISNMTKASSELIEMIQKGKSKHAIAGKCMDVLLYSLIVSEGIVSLNPTIGIPLQLLGNLAVSTEYAKIAWDLLGGDANAMQNAKASLQALVLSRCLKYQLKRSDEIFKESESKPPQTNGLGNTEEEKLLNGMGKLQAGKLQQMIRTLRGSLSH